jgi:CBS domain-containing protein
MTTITTFYLSRIVGIKAYDSNGKYIGIVKDLLVESESSNLTSGHPAVTGIKIKQNNQISYYSFQQFQVEKNNGKIKIIASQLNDLPEENINNDLSLVESVLDKQIVDLNGRKLVRVNDVRLVSLVNGTFAVAVDIGTEGLLRRIGIAKPLKFGLSLVGSDIPGKFINWEDFEAIDFSNLNIKLSKTYKKLQTLHPSDLADIIEELGKKASADIFSSLNDEQAADVMEELEPETQVQILESLSIEKAADVLDKMPADEVADIFEGLEDEKIELLLNEMEEEASQDVRELLVYPDHTVGSIMSSEFMSFNLNMTIEEVLAELRRTKPESETLYNLFVTDENEVLLATFSIRDVVISPPDIKINQIMRPSPVHLRDYQKINEVAEIVSKYNLLAIPVVDNKNVLKGMVVIDDVIEDLIRKRRTNK